MQVTRVSLLPGITRMNSSAVAWHGNSDNQVFMDQDMALRLTVVCIGLTCRGITLTGIVSLWAWARSACLLCSVCSFSCVGRWIFGRKFIFFFFYEQSSCLENTGTTTVEWQNSIEHGFRTNHGNKANHGYIWHIRTLKININYSVQSLFHVTQLQVSQDVKKRSLCMANSYSQNLIGDSCSCFLTNRNRYPFSVLLPRPGSLLLRLNELVKWQTKYSILSSRTNSIQSCGCGLRGNERKKIPRRCDHGVSRLNIW